MLRKFVIFNPALNLHSLEAMIKINQFEILYILTDLDFNNYYLYGIHQFDFKTLYTYRRSKFASAHLQTFLLTYDAFKSILFTRNLIKKEGN